MGDDFHVVHKRKYSYRNANRGPNPAGLVVKGMFTGMVGVMLGGSAEPLLGCSEGPQASNYPPRC